MQIQYNKNTSFGTKFSPKLQEALIESAKQSLLTKEHLKYIRKIKNDGLPTTLDLKPYYEPGQEELIITSPTIDKLREAQNIKPRGHMVWSYNKSELYCYLNYKELAKLFSPKSVLHLNIKWAEEDAISALKELKNSKLEKATHQDIRKIFDA